MPMRAGLPNRKTLFPVWQYIALAILFVGSLLYQLRFARDIWHGEMVHVPSIVPAAASASLETVSPEAEKLGLHKGDGILEVNGNMYTGTAVLIEPLAKARIGDRIQVMVRSGTAVHTVELPVSAATTPITKIVLDVMVHAVMPIGCILLGCWVVLVRPRDGLAWVVMGLLLCFSQIVTAFSVEGWGPGLRELAMGYRTTLSVSWPIFMFLFGFFFPEPFPFWTRLGPWRQLIPWLVIAPAVVGGVVMVWISVLQMTSYPAAQQIYHKFRPWQTPLQLYLYCVVGLGFFTAIFTKSSMAISRDAKRRLRLLYWGTTVGTVPLFVLSVIAEIRGKSIYDYPGWLIGVALAMMLIFPLTLAYVIVVQRAMDVRVVIRQGLQYGLAKNGIRVLQYISIAIVIGTALALASHSNQVEKIVIIALAVTAMFSVPRLGEPLRTWTDRRFFREAYNAEQVLSELSDQVRGMVETHSLIKTVAACVSDTLHIPRVAVLLGGSGPYRPAYALGYGSAPDVAFAASTGTVKVLQEQKEPARVYFDDPDSWVYRNPEMSEEDRAKLAQLQAELLLPLSARDKLLGFISLGTKLSDEPYSGTDVRLLKSVAAQTGLALENARLMAAMTEEVTQRERLNREIEIAREVQERLFPQTLPPIAGIAYAGACRPALGVGGDYYDFLALPGGQLGIAIGDVSGKGIAAALTMASLQASLRGEATRAPENLAALVSNVNRLVYEASSANRYATFFYGQYNPASRQLTYVNAGHNPPLLFHRCDGNWQLSRLETGGTVVGLLERFPYEQAALTIAPGDILIAFTDGISEAMNDADEEWGEQRLIETVKCCSGLSPSEIIPRIMQAADAFVAGAKQHDDMTLVVLRAQPSV
jgi:sigma-B regulation protein RsbU (phosphoserine phosphatase)